MEAKWLVQGTSPALIVFFSGWAFDEKCVAHLDATGYDVLVLYDYRSLSLPEFAARKYRSVIVIGWSFGVWAAEYAMHKFPVKPDCCYAINGTLKPVDDIEGIPIATFSATVAGLSEARYQKFMMRVCGGASAYRQMQALMSARPCSECLDELVCLSGHFLHSQFDNAAWSGALIASGDLIFPAKNMAAHWGAKGKNIEAAHLPFAHYSSWQRIIDEFKS